MTTLIRIKRRMGDEPLETILLRPKRMRLDGGTDGRVDDKVDEGLQESELPVPAVLERVATVDSKDASIEPRMLKEYRKGWEMRQTYKRLRPSEGWRDAGRRNAKEREKLQRYMITSALRDLSTTATTTTTTTAEDSKTTAAAASSNSKNSNKETEETQAEEELEYYDTQIHSGQEDVITCNGEPMTSEKFVYDLYYYPHKMDWTEFVCEQNKFIADDNEEEDEEEEEEEDENAESNWRNEYPEEEDDEEEEDMDDYDYIERPRMRRGLLKCGSDESFDLEQYEEDEDDAAFDEYGNILFDSVASLGSRLACTGLSSSDESD